MTAKAKPVTTIPIANITVFMVIRVSDDATKTAMDALQTALDEREVHSDDTETELLYEAARDHIIAIAPQFAVGNEYDISRQIIVKRQSEK